MSGVNIFLSFKNDILKRFLSSTQWVLCVEFYLCVQQNEQWILSFSVLYAGHALITSPCCYVLLVDCFYIALFSNREQTQCARMWFHVSGHPGLLKACFFEYPPKWCTYSTDWLAGAAWNCCCLSTFCVHHTTMHHVTSCKVTYTRCTCV